MPLRLGPVQKKVGTGAPPKVGIPDTALGVYRARDLVSAMTFLAPQVKLFGQRRIK